MRIVYDNISCCLKSQTVPPKCTNWQFKTDEKQTETVKPRKNFKMNLLGHSTCWELYRNFNIKLKIGIGNYYYTYIIHGIRWASGIEASKHKHFKHNLEDRIRSYRISNIRTIKQCVRVRSPLTAQRSTLKCRWVLLVMCDWQVSHINVVLCSKSK